MANRINKPSFHQPIRQTQYHLPGTSVGFEVHTYNVTGGALPPIIKPTKKKRSKLETSPFVISAEEADSYLEKMAKVRIDTEFSFQRDMCLSEDLQAIQQRSRLSALLRDRDQYDYVLKARVSHWADTRHRLSTSGPVSSQIQTVDPLALSRDPIVALAAQATAPPKPKTGSFLLRLHSTPLEPDFEHRSLSLSDSIHVASQINDQSDVSISQLRLSALDDSQSALHNNEPEDRCSSAVFHGLPKLSIQQSPAASIKIGDVAVSVCDIIADAQELKAAQLVSPTHVCSQQLRTPDQLVDLDILSYNPNDVRNQMLSHSQSHVSKEIINGSTQYTLEQQQRDSDLLVVRGSSVLDKDRAEDEVLMHNRQRHKQMIGIFTRRLKSELAGKSKSGDAAQIGGYLLHSLNKTISADQLRQEAASQRLLVFDPATTLSQIPAIRPLPLASRASSSLIYRSKSNPAASKHSALIWHSDYKK
ncbi:Hypothetical protein GLP15_1400 [Giardia lamblia P15]|uniref:Uncharacterized protein n=1 Tax=Giardia intestinalis (strain P15) TaxID=658858 RepID=E1F4W6_GIAIA|nr:Hypothetical protein GLP15_1400 [Giardia lamblia P15]